MTTWVATCFTEAMLSQISSIKHMKEHMQKHDSS